MNSRLSHRAPASGFTLIELLIVIAIILILIAIALPNFLEAQLRAKVTKAQGEIRSMITASEAYRSDWKKNPLPQVPLSWNASGISWWGFASYNLTTPNKYISVIPIDPFFDAIFSPLAADFRLIVQDPPYTYIRDSGTATWPTGANANNNPDILTRAGGVVPIPADFHQMACHSGYFYYSSGPDLVDGTVWGTPQAYSPTNGVVSFGDIYQAGPGDPYEDIKDTFDNVTPTQKMQIVRSNCS
jgi:prepilin-type N-terminal cleavage/methylation domain-containing protein